MNKPVHTLKEWQKAIQEGTYESDILSDWERDIAAEMEVRKSLLSVIESHEKRIAESAVDALVWASEVEQRDATIDRLTEKNKILNAGLEELSGWGDKQNTMSHVSLFANKALQAAEDT